MIFWNRGAQGTKAFSGEGHGRPWGQGALAPTPPLEYENGLISVADPGFWARGAQGTYAFTKY